MNMLLPGPYILDHVIRTGGSEVSLCWTLLDYGSFGSGSDQSQFGQERPVKPYLKHVLRLLLILNPRTALWRHHDRGRDGIRRRLQWLFWFSSSNSLAIGVLAPNDARSQGR